MGKTNTRLAVKGALAHCLQRHNACNAAPPAKSKMAEGVWALDKFFDPSPHSMRKVDDGEKKTEKKKRLMKIMATTSLPTVNRPNADLWNATGPCQFVTKVMSKISEHNFYVNL